MKVVYSGGFTVNNKVIELVFRAPSQQNLNMGIVKAYTKHLTIVKIKNKIYAFKKED